MPMNYAGRSPRGPFGLAAVVTMISLDFTGN